MNYEKTIRLFDEDAYRTSFEAVVIGCEPKGKQFQLVLDQTCFFPEEGGQTCDRGMLILEDGTSLPVCEVHIKADVITHMVDREVPVGAAVSGKIDWEKRFSDMQQHSGEHIVSGLVNSTFGYDNVGFHLSASEVTLDFDGEITPEQMKAIERRANEAIYQNLVVLAQYPDQETLDRLSYRSKKALEGPIRIVTVPGYDVCACCAPHVHRTGEIGIIKVIHMMKYKGGVRVNILCGMRALMDLQQKQDSVTAISTMLSAKTGEISGAVAKLLEENGRYKGEIARIERERAVSLAESVPEGERNVCLFIDQLGKGARKDLINLLLERSGGYCGIFIGSDEEGYTYQIAIRGGDARKANEALKTIAVVRGGGSKDMVQGSLTGSREEIEAVILGLED